MEDTAAELQQMVKETLGEECELLVCSSRVEEHFGAQHQFLSVLSNK